MNWLKKHMENISKINKQFDIFGLVHRYLYIVPISDIWGIEFQMPKRLKSELSENGTPGSSDFSIVPFSVVPYSDIHCI